METVFVIIGIIFVVIYFLAQDSKKETKKERYGEAVGTLAQMTSDSISGIAHDLVEPASKKQLRLAKRELALRHRRLYAMNSYGDREYIDRLFTVDERFKASLEALGLSEEQWTRIAHHIFYVGIIRIKSRDLSDYSKKNTEDLRRYILGGGGKYQSLREEAEMLNEALAYFDIPEDEWIKYGDTVIEMHNINDSNKDVEEFGYIAQIMPMKNNKHLL